MDLSRQILEMFSSGRMIKSWPVSTSRFGVGFEPGSFKTPTGWFVIIEKIGAGAPLWAEFKSRQPTGRISHPGGDEDGILTRILWLSGLEEENANTRERYIYFHGTNREDLIGTPASHGCIRMKNEDIADFFDRVPTGTKVFIG